MTWLILKHNDVAVVETVGAVGRVCRCIWRFVVSRV